VDLLLKLKVLKLPDPNDTLEIRMFFRSFFGYLETLDIKTLAQSIRSQEIFASQQSTLSKLKVDPDFLALFRVFSLLDGTCSQLNPDFNYIEALSPYTQDLFMDVAFIEYRARRDLQKMQSYPSSIVSTEQTVSRMQKQVNQTALKTRNAELLLLVGIMISHANNETAFSVYIGACMLYLIQRQITP
jgi:predicted unusual protein kinase regulating ubiquinone biosynthesis (AarF/ABC1/UbiB family)